MLSKAIRTKIQAAVQIVEDPQYNFDLLEVLLVLVEDCLEIQTQEAIQAVQTAVERKHQEEHGI